MWLWEAFYLEDPCELTFANTLLLSNAAISLGNAFINLEISSEYIIFFTLWSFFLSSLFISLQIKEFRILALSINDSLYSSLFFFLTGLHFFHLSIGLILLIYFYYFVQEPIILYLYYLVFNPFLTLEAMLRLLSQFNYIISYMTGQLPLDLAYRSGCVSRYLRRFRPLAYPRGFCAPDLVWERSSRRQHYVGNYK